MSLFQALDDYIDFFVAAFDLKMPLTIQLSHDLLQLQINPENVWSVLRRIGNIVDLRNVCKKVKAPNHSGLIDIDRNCFVQVLSEQTIECLKSLYEDVPRSSVGFFLRLDEMNIDSELELLHAFEKLKM